MKCRIWRKIASLVHHFRNKCLVPFTEQSDSDVDECGYLRPMCRTEAKGLLPQMITAVAVANDRVGTVHDGSAESVRKPNDSQPTATSRRSIFAKLSGSQTVTHEPDEHTHSWWHRLKKQILVKCFGPNQVMRIQDWLSRQGHSSVYQRHLVVLRGCFQWHCAIVRARRSKLSSVAVESLLLAKENH